MSTPTRVRRSPLSHRHAREGASWVAESAEWPKAYRAPDRESAALRQAAGLLDWGPVDKYTIKGVQADVVANGVAPGAPIGSAFATTIEGQPAVVLLVAPDETLVLLPFGGSAAALPGLLTSAASSMTDLSSGLSSFRLTGPSAPRLLQELSLADLGPVRLPDGHVVQAPLAGIHATIARIDRAGVPSYTILVPRDLAEYAWDAILESGQPFGVIPVGAAAFEALR